MLELRNYDTIPAQKPWVGLHQMTAKTKSSMQNYGAIKYNKNNSTSISALQQIWLWTCHWRKYFGTPLPSAGLFHPIFGQEQYSPAVEFASHKCSYLFTIPKGMNNKMQKESVQFSKSYWIWTFCWGSVGQRSPWIAAGHALAASWSAHRI